MDNKKIEIKSEIKELDNSEIEISSEIEGSFLVDEKQRVLKRISKNIEIPGFRKGQVPEKLVIEKVGELNILEEAAEDLIGRAYIQIVEKHKIKPIGRPEVTVTKLASGNNLEFKIKVAVVPDVKLPSYKELAKKHTKEKLPEIEVKEEEVKEILDQFQKDISSQSKLEKIDGEESQKDINVDDSFAQSLGLKNLEDLKEKLKADLKKGKDEKEKSKRRMAIMEDILNDTDIKLPKVIVESELQNMMVRFKGDIEASGLKFNDYIKKSNSSEEKLIEEWRPQAERKAKIQLILNKIAVEEKITVPEAKLEEEINKIMAQYPDADKEKATIVVETMLTNEAVFGFLETIS